MHAVHKLYLARKAQSTREFQARGGKLIRCPVCRIDQRYCICKYSQQSASQSAFLLLMHDDEVLKPSNSGRLIADVINDTHAFIWHRTDVDSALLDLINNDKYQPFLVFPKQYAISFFDEFDATATKPPIFEQCPTEFASENRNASASKTPLFIIIDATWRQAKRIFRKSKYLASLPIISIPATMLSTNADNIGDDATLQYAQESRYQVRKANIAGQLATAEVAAKVLTMFGEERTGKHLDLWFDVFCYRYQQGVMQKNKADKQALAKYLAFIEGKT